MTITRKPYIREAKFISAAEVKQHEYPYSIPAVRELPNIKFHPDVTFLVGENGSGKSTILEALAITLGFGAEGGTKNVQFQTADMISPLANNVRLIKSPYRYDDSYFLRAESFYNVATYMDSVGYLAGYGGQSLHTRSHGESFLALLLHKLRGNGLYLFDEPEAALSPTRQMTAIRAIDELVKRDSQLIIATHSPILLSYPRAKILQLDDSGIREVSYEQSDTYRTTKDFLSNYAFRLNQILEDRGE